MRYARMNSTKQSFYGSYRPLHSPHKLQNRRYKYLPSPQPHSHILQNSLIRPDSAETKMSISNTKSFSIEQPQNLKDKLLMRIQQLNDQLLNKQSQLNHIYERTKTLMQRHRAKQAQWLREKQALLAKLPYL